MALHDDLHDREHAMGHLINQVVQDVYLGVHRFDASTPLNGERI